MVVYPCFPFTISLSCLASFCYPYRVIFYSTASTLLFNATIQYEYLFSTICFHNVSLLYFQTTAIQHVATIVIFVYFTIKMCAGFQNYQNLVPYLILSSLWQRMLLSQGQQKTSPFLLLLPKYPIHLPKYSHWVPKQQLNLNDKSIRIQITI